MKKIFVVLLVISVIFSMAGCFPATQTEETSKPAETTQTEETTQSEETTQAEETAPRTFEAAPVYTIDEFHEFIGEYVDLSHYQDSNIHEEYFDSCYYSLKEEYKTAYPLDYTIKLNADTTITMPMPFQDFAAQGWNLVGNGDAIYLDPGYSTGQLYEYGNQRITVYCVNTTDKLSTYENGTIHQVLWDLFSSDDNYTTELKSAPKFTICNNINNDSTLKDIIKTLGEPTNLTYTIQSGDGWEYSYIRLGYETDKSSGYLFLTLTGDGSRIVDVDYSAALN